ncbi:N-acetyl sugar amidotransferase [Paenibacillus sp. TRM 82003]|nr:N-acetyl sugar amidotransferase [Paenibacillus sp. TRM 82003]
MTKTREYQVCANCVMDTTDSGIQFDERGFCDHCNNFYNNILPNWHPDERGAEELEKIVNKIKKDGQGKPYDCIIGFSGGVDSSYLLYYAKEVLGLRPLAFAVDTGWTLNVAVENIEKIVKGLGVDLYTEIVNWDEMRDLQLAYFKSQVPYQDTPQDHVIFASLYNYAAKHGVEYILTGANYSTECVREPYEWVYLNDLTQIKDIHKRFGTRALKTLPLCGMFKYKIYYRYFKGMKVVKPLDLIPFYKEEAISTLEKRFGWQRYANKHFESIFTRFYEGYWLIKKFNYDKRRAHFSSLVLTGQLTREAALETLKKPPYPEEIAMEDMEYVAKKLGLTKEAFVELMNGENKTYKDYKSSEWASKMAISFARLVGIEKRQFR